MRSSWWPLDWFGYLHELYIDIRFTFKVWLVGCVTCFICIERWGKKWPMVACPSWHWMSCSRYCQYLLDMQCLMYGLLFLQFSTPTPNRIFSFWKKNGLVSMDLLYIIFTYYTQRNQQEYFRLTNWFSLRSLGSWMNHLPPVWYSNFSFVLLNERWCVRFKYWRGIFYWCLVFIIVFIHCLNVTFIIPLIWFHTEVALLF